MKYRSFKIGERIVFAPDEELKRMLRGKLRFLKAIRPNALVYTGFCVHSTYGFRRRQGLLERCPGLREQLEHHARDRFFVTIDFVRAFHQLAREVFAQLFPKILEPGFDICFAELNGRQVVPIGFPTSNFLFEVFAERKFDRLLEEWCLKHGGHVTRHVDNLLVTWKKNTLEAFVALKEVFAGFEVRFTPRKPRKWVEPIRFCGVTIPRKGTPRLSAKKRADIMRKASVGSLAAAEGAARFIESWQ